MTVDDQVRAAVARVIESRGLLQVEQEAERIAVETGEPVEYVERYLTEAALHARINIAFPQRGGAPASLMAMVVREKEVG
ncbi:hypothetical protein [Consotaella salsifontis]|uniref:Uncharacterized protein n=1 Tax=Consotaella salsifontis TaxID=1365950 RepID=A0A1T4T9A5_9HYPH|nr:hypothetical protein [Consotaella salsifontis]SKA37032.1 hypothetical protein SAMN05428963_12151 [Consotaella salsifontis]